MNRTLMAGAPALAFAFGAVSATPVPATAQTIRGTLLDQVTGEVLYDAVATLTDTLGMRVATGVTNIGGRFTLETSGPGTYVLSVAAIGYERLTFEPTFLEAGSERELKIPLVPSPLPLPGLRVEVERIRTEYFLEREGFYRRRQRGFGTFFGPEELEALDPVDHADIFFRVPGVYLQSSGFAGNSLLCAGASPSLEHRGPDVPAVYIDGLRARFPNVRGTRGPDSTSTCWCRCIRWRPWRSSAVPRPSPLSSPPPAPLASS